MVRNLVQALINSEQAQNLPRVVLAFVPLLPLQPLLQHMLNSVVAANPGIFNRLGPHKNKRFMIDPTNLPFVLILEPDPENLHISARRRTDCLAYDARIAGSFLTLLDMIDGNLDGDALFFSRELIVEGDTEAVVCLRNAMDDLDGSVADDMAAVMGSTGKRMLSALRKIRN